MSSAPLWLAAASLFLIAFSAIAVNALRQFSRHELEEICQARGKRKRLIEVLRWHDSVGLAAETLQVLATGSLILSAGFWIWQRSTWSQPALWSAVLTCGLLLLLTEIWIPWAVTRLWAEPFIYRTWPLWRTLERLLKPVVWGAHFTDMLLHRLAGRVPEEPSEEDFDEEIRTIVTEGHREGLVEEDEREMIEGVIELGDATVSQIMTPRTDMICMPHVLQFHEVLDFINQAGHTRIPVYTKNRDDIIGICYAKDLLREIAASPNGTPQKSLKEMLRLPFFVPETKPVKALMQEFQLTRNHMAVVLDEYGGVSGLVTMEDVLEEIVGEIVDEYDEEIEQELWKINGHTFEALARVHIDEINDRFGLDLDEEGDFDTIGGLVFSELGHVPVVGEKVQVGETRITVLEATPRRVERVRIERLDEAARQSA